MSNFAEDIPAATPGSSIPSASLGMSPNGIVLPRSLQFGAPVAPSGQSNARISANQSVFGVPVGSRPYGAEIVKPGPNLSAPSVVTTVFQATPISNVANLVRDLTDGRQRPVLPPGLVDRAMDALPAGIQRRAVVWTRNLARFRSKRPTTSRLSRE